MGSRLIRSSNGHSCWRMRVGCSLRIVFNSFELFLGHTTMALAESRSKRKGRKGISGVEVLASKSRAERAAEGCGAEARESPRAQEGLQ